MRLIKELEKDELVVSMIAFNGELYVATSKRIFRTQGVDQLVEIRFNDHREEWQQRSKQMFELTDHKVNELNEALKVVRVDGPGAGGASHHYEIAGFSAEGIPAGSGYITIKFQNGLVKEHGVNGISQEALLAIVVDRLRGFQKGKYACRENALALTKIEEAMHWLHARTRDRIERNVEGRSIV